MSKRYVMTRYFFPYMGNLASYLTYVLITFKRDYSEHSADGGERKLGFEIWDITNMVAVGLF